MFKSMLKTIVTFLVLITLSFGCTDIHMGDTFEEQPGTEQPVLPELPERPELEKVLRLVDNDGVIQDVDFETTDDPMIIVLGSEETIVPPEYDLHTGELILTEGVEVRYSDSNCTKPMTEYPVRMKFEGPGLRVELEDKIMESTQQVEVEKYYFMTIRQGIPGCLTLPDQQPQTYWEMSQTEESLLTQLPNPPYDVVWQLVPVDQQK